MSDKSASPFFFVKAINETTEDVMTQENRKAYNPFLVNKALGMFGDSVLFANEMNQAAGLPVEMQYDFYRLGLPKRKRFAGKWPKYERRKDVKAVASFYHMSYQKALQVVDFLDEGVITELINRYDLINSDNNDGTE